MITADLIIPALKASSKKQLFQAIAQEAAALFNGKPEMLFNALLDRERIGSTGIGSGVAIPHIKCPTIDRMYGVLIRLEEPVDYDALDGNPVDILFMLLAPAESKTTQHLKTLAQISRLLKDNSTCALIRSTPDRSQIENLLQEWIKAQAA